VLRSNGLNPREGIITPIGRQETQPDP